MKNNEQLFVLRVISINIPIVILCLQTLNLACNNKKFVIFRACYT